MDSLRKSFRSQGSYKRSSSRNPSFDQEQQQEQQPILFEHLDEFVVRVDGNTGASPAKASYDFFLDSGGGDRFVTSEKQQRGETSLDIDLEMEEIKKPNANASRELRVSFRDPSRVSSSSEEDVKAGSSSNHSRDASDGGEAEVLRCTGNSSFRRTSTLLRAKTRSRLMDPPPAESMRKSGWIPKSGQLKSGMLGRPEDDDDDPFIEEDVPEDLTRDNWSILTVLQWISLFVIVTAFFCSLFIGPLQRLTVWELHLWKWTLLVLVLFCGRLVSGWFIRIIVVCFERSFLLRKRVLYFVYGVRRAVQNCLWLGLVLLAWHYMFDEKVARETRSKTLPYVTKVLLCLLIANIFRLIKTLLVKVLASSFHVSTYFDRIQESLFNQYVIEALSGPPLIELQHIKEEEDRVLAEMQKLQRAGATIPNDLRAAALPSRGGRVIGGVGGSGRISAQRTTTIGAKSVRFSGVVSRKDFSRQLQPPPQQEGITIEQLHKLNQKNISAWNMKRLMRIVRHGTLTTLDEQILQAGSEDESATEIRERENRSQGRCQEDLQQCRQAWLQINAFRERRALSLTLNDTKTAVNKLHQMANVVVAIIVFGLWLLTLGIATTHFFVLISSQALVAVFMFGNTLKMIFEAIIFLFVMHPFDVGDRCEVEGIQMIVEEMNILTTVFLRYDNQKIIYPNSLLATKPISNIYRSPDMGDAIDFCVHVSTPVQKLAIMKEKIEGYIQSKKEHWYPTPTVMLKDVDDMNRLKVAVWLRHRINYQDMGLRWQRREMVLQEMIKVLRELNIEFRMLPLDVNVRDLPALTSSRLPSTWTTCS
ncbi:hypothetical protein J5N97_022697 [Dioscorea zingiberensis]|uniref:Mechanosensitive ion channel protein n=1 Tax=Dioscorea zingiberensis TaxID=325984 RepID=A0A9D5CCF2_9LILI|nr:hypothetical protein J5N97_022697 [Dioscorea zingiberensis]